MANTKPANKPTQAAAPAPTQAAAPAPTQAAAPAVPATYAGLPTTALTKSQLAFATAKHPVALAPKLAPATLRLGTVAYKVRSANNLHWWQAVQAALAAGNGSASAQAMVAAGACPKFVGYAVARKWLAPAAQG